VNVGRTVGEYILDRLRAEWGVQRVFGYPGDGINGVTVAFDDDGRSRRPEFVQVRHEEMAALMACAHAKFTGEVGVCMATSGPGAIHLLNGLYDAKLDHQPVVALVGQQARLSMGGDFQQEVDLLSLFKDVAHEYVQVAMDAAQVRHLVDRAMRIALAERTVTCLILPSDLQEAEAVVEPPREHGAIHSGSGFVASHPVPDAGQLERAAKVLNAGERVAILVGQGALGAAREVADVAEVLGAGAAKALLGKAALPDDLPWVTGAIGLLGTKPSWTLMDECDTLLIVGSSFPYSEFLPPEGQARAVQIDIDGKMLGLRYPSEVNLVGDSAATLRALLPLLERMEDRQWRERIEREVGEWWRLLEDRAARSGDPINPQLLFSEFSRRAPEGAIMTVDSGSATDWFARHVRIREGMMCSVSGTLATMGCAVPYAIAAKLAHPQRPVIAFVGDGAMQMNGLAELITAAKYTDRWDDQRLVFCVLNNRDLNQVTWEQRAMVGAPKFEGSQVLPDVRYADWARMIGLAGRRIETPAEVGPAWDEALAADGPYVLDFVTDPETPPLPPHVTVEQAKSFARAMLRGDPGSRAMLSQLLKQKQDELLPSRH
jgi:pyruvate dehydrogenase (quinone)